MKTKIFFLILFSTTVVSNLFAQSVFNRDTFLVAAREIMMETTFCGLVTVDTTGQPQVRTMNPIPVEDDLTVWFATSRNSEKVKEIRANPKVSVYFADHNVAKGSVNISGTTEIIDDKELLVNMKREYWEGIPNWQDIFVLIKITPQKLKVIDYKHGLSNDPKTSAASSIDF